MTGRYVVKRAAEANVSETGRLPRQPGLEVSLAMITSMRLKDVGVWNVVAS